MSRWPRTLLAGLFAILVLGVSCTGDEMPVSPSIGAPAAPDVPAAVGEAPPAGAPSTLLGATLQKLNLLSCSRQPSVTVTTTVGAEGGIINIGTHRLTIPADALTQRVAITAEQVPGRVNSVRFSPDGLRFAKPAQLTLSYANCSPILLGRTVVYVDELLRILELIPSRDNRGGKTVTGAIRHFSRYAVAW